MNCCSVLSLDIHAVSSSSSLYFSLANSISQLDCCGDHTSSIIVCINLASDVGLECFVRHQFVGLCMMCKEVLGCFPIFLLPTVE